MLAAVAALPEWAAMAVLPEWAEAQALVAKPELAVQVERIPALAEPSLPIPVDATAASKEMMRRVLRDPAFLSHWVH